MRRRIGGEGTGLGNPAPHMLENNGELTNELKKCLKEAIKLYFKGWGGCDYSVKEERIEFGIEPSYQYDHLRIIALLKDKELSYQEQGRAWGAWGSQISSTRKYYKDYKYNAKFKKFVDKWHDKVINSLK